ncbi:NodT family efflux transporter outer membrane factor (OMF) lipoprotein [Tahibacter aquaticus]|uniref:NodT family efflux transporter outer membrane factor (OMF) lipoprotein n=1 Tax=Tahibacter aquaticus TaxID=520092 RepID=A0A4R6YMM0_9GAMM|nr:efflux transporter outer membrane subunit [Tahibacter aquaticus]TDR38698.1 NodT family efflux transporter outer membrane factor (OMF) lipoprotein [Tahibacter aquaticus]
MQKVDFSRLCLLALGLSLALAGCSLAPPLQLPEVATAAQYKEQAPWTAAAPADRLPREHWWTLYGDAELDRLQQQLQANSPDLAAALARYEQARAYGDQLHSGLFPSLGLGGNASRERQSATRPPTGSSSPRFFESYDLGLQAAYELDLWGRVRNSVAAGDHATAAAAADLESARLSLQAELADDYIVLRGLDQQGALLADTVTAYDKAVALTQKRRDAGIASGLDVARAQTQLDMARSQVAQNLAQRAVAEHAIAALVGESPSGFSLAAGSQPVRLPAIPLDLPSTLLQRRPDIAAAQRRTAAANASVGVARAAWFPSIGLNASFGYQSNQAGGWLSAPNAAWAIGPSLLLDLFDTGKRRAQVTQARAALDEAGANYRGVVLGAFQQVEDNLALLQHYKTAAEAEQSAVASARRSLDFAMTRYREGAVSYLEVVQSQTSALTAQRAALDLDTRQLRASVALIRALGGGWQADTDLAAR